MSFPLSSTAEQARSRSRPRPALRLVSANSRTILVAGSDADVRSALARELAEELPKGTRFEEIERTHELLERAPFSRLVMLTGELDGVPAEVSAQMLARRHPKLPVLTLEAQPPGPRSLDSVRRTQRLQPSAGLACV